MQKVFLSVIDYNGAESTREFLLSVDKLVRDTFELGIVVIDNASRDPFTLGDIQLKISPHIIRTKENLGFTGGHNMGIAYALSQGADYVVVINNDTVVNPDLVEELLAVSNSSEYIGIAAPKIYFAKGYEYHKTRYKPKERGRVFWYAGGIIDWRNVIGYHRGVDEVDRGQFDTTEETGYASGCAMMIKKEVLEKIKGFDDKYFLYYEDADLSMRVKKAGFTIMYAPKAVLWHKNAASAGGSGSVLQDYYISRNRLLFGMRYAMLRAKLALLREALRIIRNGRTWQKKGVMDFFMRRFGKAAYSF